MNATSNLTQKLALVTAVALCAVATTACGDGDDGCGASTLKTLDGKVDTGRVDVDTVQVRAQNVVKREDGAILIYQHFLAETPFSHGGFKLNLPCRFDDQALDYAVDRFNSNLSVSDKSAKGAFAVELAALVDGVFAGYFGYGKFPVRANLVYVDRDVSIAGATSNANYEVHFTRGWNWAYQTVGSDLPNSLTSSDPGGLAWSFEAR